MDALPFLNQLRPYFLANTDPVYLVGGVVRDLLLRRPVHDLDFVVEKDAIRLAFRVADGLDFPAYVLDRQRDAGRVVPVDINMTLDFTRFRGPDLKADLLDRDFTINAMAIPAVDQNLDQIIDPCDGRSDLVRRLIRQTHQGAIADDPVRALRALRLALELDFSLTSDTFIAVTSAASMLGTVSIERVRDEFLKLLQTAKPERGLTSMAETGLLIVILPEIAALESIRQSTPHREPVLAHTASVLRWLVPIEKIALGHRPLDNAGLGEVERILNPYVTGLGEHLSRVVDGGLDGRLLLRLGALFHDVGKGKTQIVEPDGRIRFFGHDQVGAAMAGHRLRRLRLSNEAIKHVEGIVSGHMRPLYLANESRVSRRAVYRFFRATDSAGLDIGLLALADHLATYDGVGHDKKAVESWQRLLLVVGRLFDHYFQRYEETIRPLPLLNGKELMETLELAPGPEIGRLLSLIEESQAAGEINTREEALALAARNR